MTRLTGEQLGEVKHSLNIGVVRGDIRAIVRRISLRSVPEPTAEEREQLIELRARLTALQRGEIDK